MKRYENKTVLVSGAASGIGMATAQRLASEGAQLFLVDVQEQGLVDCAKQLAASGASVSHTLCDVSSETDVSACFEKCLSEFGSYDAVCNIAAILRFDNFHELSLAAWQKLIDVNLTGVFLMCREAIPHLLERQGNIVNVASTAGIMGLAYGGAYSASKGGVAAMTRSIAVEYGPRGLRANCVAPADIKTAMTAAPEFPAGADMKLLMRSSSLSGVKGPEVVADVIAMLASSDGCHINGENIRVDGAALS